MNGGNGVTGWGGGSYEIRDRTTQALVATGGLSTGTVGYDMLCLPDGCYSVQTVADQTAPNMEFDMLQISPINVLFVNRPPGAYNFEIGSGCTPSCLPSETVVRVNMNGGNLNTGWSGGKYTITDRLANDAHVLNGTLVSGRTGNDQFCLPDGCYSMTVTGGSAILFDLISGNNGVYIDQPVGSYDFEIGNGCTPQCTSSEALMKIWMNGGLPNAGWDGATYQITGTSIQGGLTSGCCGQHEFCLPLGCHEITVGGGSSDNRVLFDLVTLSVPMQVHFVDQGVGTRNFCNN